MRVRELIEYLENFDGDLVVVVSGYEWGYDDANVPTLVRVGLDERQVCYGGTYDDAKSTPPPHHKMLFIGRVPK